MSILFTVITFIQGKRGNKDGHNSYSALTATFKDIYTYDINKS